MSGKHEWTVDLSKQAKKLCYPLCMKDSASIGHLPISPKYSDLSASYKTGKMKKTIFLKYSGTSDKGHSD